MDTRRSQLPLYRFFQGLAEYTFQTRLGVADPPLIEYVSTLLCRFMHMDDVYSVRNPSGRRLEEVAEMLVEAEARLGAPRREVHRHIGDFTLFWTGMYPETLRRLKRTARLDHFIDYCEQGKRAYFIASTIRDEQNDEESDVLARLSHEFELCAFGLGELRKEWERRDPESGDASARLLIE